MGLEAKGGRDMGFGGGEEEREESDEEKADFAVVREQSITCLEG